MENLKDIDLVFNFKKEEGKKTIKSNIKQPKRPTKKGSTKLLKIKWYLIGMIITLILVNINDISKDIYNNFKLGMYQDEYNQSICKIDKNENLDYCNLLENTIDYLQDEINN